MTYQLTFDWQKEAEKRLVGLKIVGVRWMTSEEAESMEWWKRPITLMLDDGTILIPQADDEGNDGGALWIYNASEDTNGTDALGDVMPVMSLNDVEVGEEHAKQES